MQGKIVEQPLWTRLLRPFVAVMGLGVCVACGLAAWQLSAPTSAPTIFPFSETWYDRAMASATPGEGVRDAKKAVELAPTRAGNWMLLAYQYSRADGAISSRVIEAIRQSYVVGPLDLDVTAYRLSFIFRAWPALPMDIRDLAINEARQFGPSAKGVEFLDANVPTIADERARLQFAIIGVIAHQQFGAIVQQRAEKN